MDHPWHIHVHVHGVRTEASHEDAAQDGVRDIERKGNHLGNETKQNQEERSDVRDATSGHLRERSCTQLHIEYGLIIQID